MRSRRRHSLRRSMAACALVGLIPTLGPARQSGQPIPPPQPTTAPYDAVTDFREDVANFNPEPFSGIGWDSLHRAWIVNPYASTVVRYTMITPAPDIVVPTGLHPVSVAVWEPGPTIDDAWVLVACTGTHALFAHDPNDGSIKGFLRLDSEPADLVVDEDNDLAFVSCQGSNTVQQINLTTFSIVKTYPIPCGRRAGSLYLDRVAPEVLGDNRLYVAAAVTGNNSVPRGPGQQAAGSILDLDGNDGGELPDEDVFRIDPFAQTLASVVRGAGSLLFALDRNPLNGELWILSTDSLNKDEDVDTEPLLRGAFAVNQLVRVAGVDGSSGLIEAPDGIDLDDIDPGDPVDYDAARSINQARAIDFLTMGGVVGFSFVVSPFSDKIVALDPTGDRVLEFDLPDGAQCYDVEIWPANQTIFGALCLGTMTVEVFSWSPYDPDPVASVPLGLDPTPAQVRRGRDVFLDGERSKDARFSCASCHPRGISDQLAWPLRGHPCDQKDIMLTQSLLSIVDTFPHHWRGERDLEDFRKAFGGLLGAEEALVPDDEEMRDFIVFLQSLRAPANPIQNPRRLLDETRGTDPAPNGLHPSPIQGQRDFDEIVNFNGQTCGGCHQIQSGTDATHVAEVVNSRAPRAIPLEVAHLRQLQHRGLDTVIVGIGPNQVPVEFNENGFGNAHAGAVPSLFRFIFDPPVFFALDEQQRTNVFGFVEQFDQGTSPAEHYALPYAQGATPAREKNIKEILIDGAESRWNDVVAIGTYDAGAGLAPMRWWYDHDLDLFVAEDPAVPSLSWTEFKAKTQSGLAENVMIGVPPGSGERFGIDHDGDGLLNDEEGPLGTDPWQPDFDGDGWPDGYEHDHDDDPLVAQSTSSDDVLPELVDSDLSFANSRLAKYHVVFSEDVQYTVTYSTPGGPARTFTREDWVEVDTFVLTHEEPSTATLTPLTFDVQIQFHDRNGNPGAAELLAPFQPDDASFPVGLDILDLHVAEMEWLQEDRNSGTLDAQVRIATDFNYGAPDFDLLEVEDQMVFCIVSVKRLGEDDFVQATELELTTSHPTDFRILDFDGVSVSDYLIDPGPPWIASPHTDASGETVIGFELSGLSGGDIVKVSVMGVVRPGVTPSGETPPVYDEVSLFQLQPLLLEDTMELRLTY